MLTSYRAAKPVAKNAPRPAVLDLTDSTRYNSIMPPTKPHKLTDAIRQAMDDSGLSRYRIAQETGVSESTLSKFHLGHRGLSMEALDALAEFLQITIRVGRKPVNQQKGK